MNASATPTLYELAEDLRALEDLLAEEDGHDLDDADVIAGWLADLEGALEEKVERTVAVVRTFEQRAHARRAEAERLAKLADYDDNAAKRLKARVQEMLELAKLKRVDTLHYSVTVATNGGKAPLILDNVDPEQLPAAYRKTVPARVEPDKAEMRKALEAGVELPFARLGERGRHLKIR